MWGGRDAQWEPCRTCLHSVPPGLKPGTREVTSWARSKFLGLWILLDILTQRPPPAQDEECEQGQDEAAPTVRLFQGRGTWRSSGGISAVKGNLETMVVNPLLGQKRKLSPERGRGCSKATQPVSCSTETHPTSSASQPSVASTWLHCCPARPLPKPGDDLQGPLSLPQTELSVIHRSRSITGRIQEELRIPGPENGCTSWGEEWRGGLV